MRFRLIVDGTTKKPSRLNYRLSALVIAILLALFEQFVAAITFLVIALLLSDILYQLQLLGRRRQIDGFDVKEREETR